MSSVEVSSESADGAPPVNAGEFRLEVVVLPVSDVDRAKEFYGSLGWRLDADVAARRWTSVWFSSRLRAPACSIQFGTNIASGAPGSAQSLYLAVPDIEAARDELLARGVEVGEVFHEGTRALASTTPAVARAGARPRHLRLVRAFSDPDGNGWLLQEITTRLPGR